MRLKIVIGAVFALVLALSWGGVMPAAAQGPEGTAQGGAAPSGVYYTVKPGNTVYGIARMYGVPQTWITEANGLRPPYIIRVGQVLFIPTGQPYVRTYVVRPGDTLFSIGQRFGIPWRDIAAANGLQYPFTIYSGHTLIIPGGAPIPPGPWNSITSPAPGATVSSPVVVSGVARAAFENTIVVKVYNAAGQVVGQAPASVQAEPGQSGPYSVSVPFTIPPGVQNGRIEVLDYSPADGHVVASSVQLVRLRR
jgi:LysM repeat protein